ncbi:glutathione-dependent formaldehyde-activating enzyme family protein, partial [Vibrio parahaemolyticus EKP-028]
PRERGYSNLSEK